MTTATTEKTAAIELNNAGASLEKREDRFGDTRTGWWLDGVYLGKKATDALRIMRGGQ